MPALTKRICDNATYTGFGKNRCVLWDEKLKGFGLRVNPSGSKCFIIRYRPHGTRRARIVKIGDYGVFTVEQARQEAKLQLFSVAKGEDPLVKKRSARDAATVSDLARRYLDTEGKHKKTAKEIERRINKWLIPAIGRKPVASVTTKDLIDLHYAIGEASPIEANRVRSIAHLLFECARDWDMGIQQNQMNPASKVKKFTESSRERIVPDHELPDLWEAIEAEDLHVQAALKLLLHTGCRKNEILRLRWRDVDLREKAIRLPNTKNGKAESVAIVAEVEEIILQLPRGFGETKVFPQVDIKRAWARVRARFWLALHPEDLPRLLARAEADIAARSKHAVKDEAAIGTRLLELVEIPEVDRLTIHDLRRTVGTSVSKNHSPTVVAKVLRNPTAVDVYTRIQDNDARAALEEHSARLARLVTRKGA